MPEPPSPRRAFAWNLAFSWEIGERICRRIEAGESLRRICADPDMPAKSTLMRWRLAHPEFGLRYAAARGEQPSAPRPPVAAGRVRYSRSLGLRVCLRVLRGETVEQIAADPRMPGRDTLHRWVGQRPEFAEDILWAWRFLLWRMEEEAWRLAEQADKAGLAVAKLRLHALKKQVGWCETEVERALAGCAQGVVVRVVDRFENERRHDPDQDA
jgi:hypothetical protein